MPLAAHAHAHAPAPSPAPSRAWWAPLAVLLLGALLSVAFGIALERNLHASEDAEFDHLAQRTADALSERFRKPLYGLNGARGVFATHETITAGHFRRYVATRNLPVEFPGVHGLGYVQVQPSIAAPRGPNPELEQTRHLVVFAEPADSQRGVVGLDLATDDALKQSVELALMTGQPQITSLTRMLPGPDQGSVMLLLQPIHDRPATMPSGTARDLAEAPPLHGVLFATIVVRDLLAGLPDVVSGELTLELFDTASGVDVRHGLYDSRQGRVATSEAAAPLHEATMPVSLPGRQITMRLRSTPQFESHFSMLWSWLAGAGGVLASVLLAALLQQQMTGRQRAERLARRATAELAHLAMVASRTSNSVIITDAHRRITWVNAGFERMTGYSAAEVIGQSPGALLQTETTDANTVSALREALAAGQGFHGEIFNRGKHGRGYWLDIDIQPLRQDGEAGGPITGYMAMQLDITERKAADAALRASQSFLARTGKIARVGGWTYEPAAGRVGWSDETCRLHELPPGYAPSLDDATAYYTTESRPLIAAAVQRCVGEGTPFDLELRLVTARGRELWVHVVGEREQEPGQPTRLIGAIQDVSARLALTQQLEHNHALINSVLDSLPCGLLVIDADLTMRHVNPETARLLQLPPALVRAGSTRFEDMVRHCAERGDYGSTEPAAVAAAITAVVDRVRGPIVPHQFERTGPGGALLEVRGGPLPGGGFVTTYTDVTARRAAEAEAQSAGRLLRGAIDAIDEAFVLFDPDDRLVLCNERYREFYPLVADLAVPGARFEDLVRAGAQRGSQADAVGRVEEWVQERLAQHRAANSTLIQPLSDGRTLRIVERRLPDGHIVGFRIDITEFVRARQQAEAAKLEAEQASLAKSQFLANMSHEIRTPMNAILGMLALLKKTDLSTRQTDYAGKTEGAARSLLGLLNDILDFSKVEAGKMTLDPQPFRIDRLLRDLGVILSASVGVKPLEVLFDIDARLPRALVGDAMRLQQVLINLAGNAIKFTARGEVVVAIEALGDVRPDATAVALRIGVRDTGIGIAPENQARIFSGFTQAEASTTRRYGGTGLGVAISQRLVALMGGDLQLDSALGQGSCFHFTLTLPVASAEEARRVAPDEDNAPVALSDGTLHALIVDDNPTAREVLLHMAGALGWAADVAAGGEEALRLMASRRARGESYGAVFVDWQMPGLDGWSTANQIRAGGLPADAPLVVMVTAHGREALDQRSQEDQALLDGYLVKPVTASMLLDAVVDARRARHLPHPSQLMRAMPAVHGPRLAGLRLLVVEDNLNNQQVARELLEDEGALVQVAANGQLGVEAVAAAAPPFDAVLMDLQMPVMDGFTATRCIRQDLRLTALPIVAMTANAMASDRDACLAAGMNEHVGKPFDLDRLVATLLRLAGPALQGTAAALGPPSAPPVVRAAGDAAAPHRTPAPSPLATGVLAAAAGAGVDLPAALARLGGRRDVYRRLLGNFVIELRGVPAVLAQQIAVASEPGDGAADGRAPDSGLAEAARTLHTLKGLAATLGAGALAAQAALAEQRLHDQPAAAERAIAALQAAIAQSLPTLIALNGALDTPAAEPPARPGTSAPGSAAGPGRRALLEALEPLLAGSDMQATALAEALRGAADPALLALADAVDALDFERALELCRSLRAEVAA